MAKFADPLEATPLEEYLDSLGREQPNPTPVAPPVGFVKQPSMVEHIRGMVRSELMRQEVERAGFENFEEADDFNIDDDPIDPTTPYEAVFDPPPVLDPPAQPAQAPPVGGAPALPPDPAPIVPSAPAAPAVTAAPASKG